MAKRKRRYCCYLMGEPASGKTTVAKKLTGSVPRKVRKAPHISWTHIADDTCELGHDREAFGGTDVLSLAAQPHLLQHIKDGDLAKYRYIFGEGDRLANPKFFTAMLDLGFELRVYALVPPAKVIERRRAKRNASLGKDHKPHSERWVKTRQTKVRNLIDTYSDHVTVLNGKTDESVELILSVDPVAQRLAELR